MSSENIKFLDLALVDPVTKVDLTVSATLPKLFSQAIRLMDYLVVHVVKFILVGAFF